MRVAWVGLILACAACQAAPQPAVRSMADLRQYIAGAIASKAAKVVIPPGIYRGGPAPGSPVIVNLNDISNLNIDATGVTMMCTERTRAIALDRCRNVTLSGLTIDYDPLTFTQGKVIAAAADKSWVDIQIDAGYPRKPWSRIDVVDPATHYRVKGMPFLWGATAEMIEPDVVRVRLKGIGNAAPAGMLASLSAGNEPGGVCHGITIDDCQGGMVLRDITIHCAPGMGIVEGGGAGGTVLDGIRIVPGPPPAGGTAPRLLTTSWDGILHDSVGKGPTVENCVIEDCGDDSWSDQSSDYLTLKSDGSTVIVAARGNAMWLRDGDRLRLSNDSPQWRIVKVENVTLKQANLPPDVVARLASAQPYTLWKTSDHYACLTLDRPATFGAGQSFFSPSRQGNGFVFRSNRVHSSGRILVKASDGLIEDNTLRVPHGVVLCPELPAEAAAGIHDITIRHNSILESGYFCPAPWSSQAGAISISASGEGAELRPAGVFDHITIEDNTLSDICGLNLLISSARNVLVKGNRFVDADQSKPSDTGARYGIDQAAVVWVSQSQGVRFEGNQVIERGPLAGPVVAITGTSRDVAGVKAGFSVQSGDR